MDEQIRYLSIPCCYNYHYYYYYLIVTITTTIIIKHDTIILSLKSLLFTCSFNLAASMS